MEILALSLLKTLASTCLKFYLGYLFSAGGIDASKSDLGYTMPSWYMNPGRQATAFYAYGTSVEGDEFASIEDARQQAVNQMATLIRRSHQRIITEEIRYDQGSIKQKRLVELFLRGENLDTFILNHAVLDKKSVVKVKGTPPDLRAFVRLKLETDDYVKHQDATLRELRKKLTFQKSEDIMEEMEAEMKALKTREAPDDIRMPPVDTPIPTPAAATEGSPLQPGVAPEPSVPPPPPPVTPSGSVFDAMEGELDKSI
jgi:hypothetical protein